MEKIYKCVATAVCLAGFLCALIVPCVSTRGHVQIMYMEKYSGNSGITCESMPEYPTEEYDEPGDRGDAFTG